MRNKLRKLRKDLVRFKQLYEYTQQKVYQPRKKRRFGAISLGDVARNYQDLLRQFKRVGRWRRRARNWMKPKG